MKKFFVLFLSSLFFLIFSGDVFAKPLKETPPSTVCQCQDKKCECSCSCQCNDKKSCSCACEVAKTTKEVAKKTEEKKQKKSVLEYNYNCLCGGEGGGHESGN